MNQKQINAAVLVAVTLSIASCATSRVETNFGDAVNSNMEAQMYDPLAANRPSTETPLGTDGMRMEAVMESHRGETGNGESVSQPIVISVGN